MTWQHPERLRDISFNSAKSMNDFKEYVEYVNAIMFDGAEIIEEKLNHPDFLNRCSSDYYCDQHWGNALSVACEFRSEELMEVLLRLGADPNLEIDGYTPFESAIMGHGAYWIYNFEEIESCIQLLLKYGAKRELHNTCIENHGTEDDSQLLQLSTKEAGPYLNEFITDMALMQIEQGKNLVGSPWISEHMVAYILNKGINMDIFSEPGVNGNVKQEALNCGARREMKIIYVQRMLNVIIYEDIMDLVGKYIAYE